MTIAALAAVQRKLASRQIRVDWEQKVDIVGVLQI
jgi:hypothetical protein